MSKIPGIILRPCSATLEDNEKVIRSSKYFTDSNFYNLYCEHVGAMEVIAESAKIYILKHYEQISDWSRLSVKIYDNTGNATNYYKHDDGGWNVEMKEVLEIVKSLKNNENPVQSLTDVVLDPTDGDFSVTINGRDHLWIDDDSIVTIADYIEKELSKVDKISKDK